MEKCGNCTPLIQIIHCEEHLQKLTSRYFLRHEDLSMRKTLGLLVIKAVQTKICESFVSSLLCDRTLVHKGSLKWRVTTIF